jgi:outer membrane protein assembly factor BamE (lipoprotein component of BamABCDE complex)
MQQKIYSFLCLFLVLSTTACIPPRIENRGYVDAMKRIDQVQENVSTRDDVRQLLGTPSVTNNYGDETWYYIYKQKKAVAFLKPEITAQHVTRITFDQTGLVTKVEKRHLKDSQQVAVAEEVTPTEGQQLGFFEQILGNVGRFNGGNTSGDRARAPSSARR